MYIVIGTDTYLKQLKKWSAGEREIASKLPLELKGNPYSGKPLNYRFLREKKVREKRIYYLVYDDLKLVLLVATSQKKDQQATIDHIKSKFKEFRTVAEDISRQVS